MKPVLEYDTELGMSVTKRGEEVLHREYYVKNCDGKKFTISPALYDLLDHADGWHPFVRAGVSPERMKRIEKDLVRHQILRTSRFVHHGLLNRFILLPVGAGIQKAQGLFARLNRMLPWLMLIWLGIGACAGMHLAANPAWWSELSVPLLTVLTTVSVLIHEGAHLTAAVAYGCEVYELGLLLFGIVPYGAYVLLGDEPKGRLQRVQLDLAGPESNLMVAGIYMVLATVIHDCEITFLIAASVSFILGLVNCIPAVGLDGHGALSGLFGVESLHDIARDTVFDRKARRRLLSRGSSGRRCLCLLLGVLFCDLLVAVLIGVDVLQVFLAIRSIYPY